MKLNYLLENLDKSDKNMAEINLSEFASMQFAMHIYNKHESTETKRLQVYNLSGHKSSCKYNRAYFLDKILVGIEISSGSLYGEMAWVSGKAKNNMKRFLLSQERAKKRKDLLLTKDILDSDIGDRYTINNTWGAIFTKTGMYKNKSATIKLYHHRYADNKLTIKFKNGKLKTVPIKEFHFDFPLIGK